MRISRKAEGARPLLEAPPECPRLWPGLPRAKKTKKTAENKKKQSPGPENKQKLEETKKNNPPAQKTNKNLEKTKKTKKQKALNANMSKTIGNQTKQKKTKLFRDSKMEGVNPPPFLNGRK